MSSSSDDCVCDYYCEVGVREHLSPAEGSNSGAYISKSSADKSNIALLTTLFEPTVLLRIPTEDRPGAGMKFAPEVAMFCFPHGVRLVTPDEAAVFARLICSPSPCSWSHRKAFCRARTSRRFVARALPAQRWRERSSQRCCRPESRPS